MRAFQGLFARSTFSGVQETPIIIKGAEPSHLAVASEVAECDTVFPNLEGSRIVRILEMSVKSVLLAALTKDCRLINRLGIHRQNRHNQANCIVVK